ncbi:nose resistant to fluoxetine protein 6-like [Topomyia yanbarensis]|uniref:nose resistant to fluoxetine protein 6-like n=1 Tax=Topomyia yanbarensis TaxID=2498891 RepID=UPI00273AC2A0|nr:nose resistant to fluoxetine protein 6-like [Topomyia yanbarensis]
MSVAASVGSGSAILAAVVLLLNFFPGSVIGREDAATETGSMPALYRFDNYGECMENEGTYCMVRSLLRPNLSSELWLHVKNFSADVRHFRRNLLERGICIDECLKRLSGLGKKQRDELLVAPFEVDFKFRFNRKYFPRLLNHEELYGDVVNECVNQQLRLTVDLDAYSEIEYCQESNTLSEPLDFFDILCIVIISFVCSIAALSTLFDYYLRIKSDKENYFEIAPQQIEYQFATICSIPRNLKTLTVPPKSVLGHDFQFIEGIRFITMALIIHLHTTVMLMSAPSEHPEQYEETLDNPVLGTLSLMTPNLVQSFFTIGGILLTVNLLESLGKESECRWKLIWDKVTNRLKRILPLYLFVILVTATIYRHLKLGPLYDRAIGMEAKNCRMNWWINLLFLNNYVLADETCVQPSWYLSADFQFYLFGLVALITMKRYQRSTKYWISFMILLNLIGPGITMWAWKLPPVMATGTRPVLLMFSDDEWFSRLYKPSHTSSAGYFYGILAGMVYHHAKHSEQNLINRKDFRIVKALSILVIVVCYLPCYLIYETNWELYSWSMPIYGSIAKNCWGFHCSVSFIELALSQKNRLKTVLGHKWLLPLGKLTYSVYHSHYLILMAFTSIIRAPLVNDVYSPILFAAVTLVLSYGLGLIIFLLVEQPAANLLTSKNNYIERIGNWVTHGARECLKRINKVLF